MLEIHCLKLLLIIVMARSMFAAPADPRLVMSDVSAQGTGPLVGCRDSPADIYFLLDCSSSVWIVDYEKQLDFVISLVQKFDIAPNATRVGLGIFSDDFRPVIDMGGYPDKDTLVRAIKATPYLSGNTYTGKGIHGMRVQGFRQSVSRKNVTKIGVVVTDGRSRHRSNTVAESSLAQEQGIWLFAIGVGSSVDQEELASIASDPKNLFSFHVASFDILITLAEKLAISTCSLHQPQADGATCGQSKKADIMFVYNSAGMSVRNVETIREFVKNVVGKFSMTSGNVRAGVISQGCQGGDIQLSEYLRRNDFAKALQDQPNPSLAPLLKKLRSQGFESTRGGRQSALKMAVVFVDDVMLRRNDTLYEALLLKYDDVLVHVIAVGALYDKEQVKLLASSPNYVTEFRTHEELKSLSQQKTFLDKFCQKL